MKAYDKQVKLLAAIGILLIAAVFIAAAFAPLERQKVFRNSSTAASAESSSEQVQLFPIELNSATQAQLETVPGIGEKTAAKIIAYRDAHGGFNSVEDLLEVEGIGEKKLASIRDYVCVK
ncbi:MAG: helix-hairpin-helix domain-containing protein [Clostridia bacterium]|nr:helix-hairpin-helix domain-containing protein [Clostridia bacterium]